MQENDSLRTVECLRGRLQAERAASRAAEHNAQLMANKVCSFPIPIPIPIPTVQCSTFIYILIIYGVLDRYSDRSFWAYTKIYSWTQINIVLYLLNTNI